MTPAVESYNPPMFAMADRVSPAPMIEFIFVLDVGALRRSTPDEMATKMAAAGLDVSWTDTRSGLFGIRRRFVVRGPKHIVRSLASAVEAQLGWEPGAVSLSALYS